MSSHNPFFKAEDLQSLEMTINGVNATSSVPFPKGSIKLREILADGVWIDIPSRSCSMGHSLRLEIIGKKFSEKTGQFIENEIHVLGIIEELEGDVKAGQQVRLKFRQYSVEEWQALLGYLTETQKNINAVIKRARK